MERNKSPLLSIIVVDITDNIFKVKHLNNFSGRHNLNTKKCNC